MLENDKVCYFQLEGGRLPERKTEGSAAYDLTASETTIIRPGRNSIPVGFRMAFDNDIEALIETRSGFALKGFVGYDIADIYYEREKLYDADVIVGKLDSDFRGIPRIIVKSYENKPFVCKEGTAIAQLTFVRIAHPEFIEVDTLPDTERGEGGFGHTGNYGTDK